MWWTSFLTSMPFFLLLLGSFGKTRWPPRQFFYFIFSIDFLLQTSHILTVKLLLPSQPMHPHYIFPLEGRSNKLILPCRENFQPFHYYCTETDIHFSTFWRWPPFSRWLPWGNIMCFSISFSWLTFLFNRKKQQRYGCFWLYISEYWHEIGDIYYAFALFLPAHHR